MPQRYWMPKPMENESLTLLATFPSSRRIDPQEVPFLVEDELDRLIEESREQGLFPETFARELLGLDSNRLTGSQVLQTEQGQALLLSLNYQETDLMPLPEEQRQQMENLSLLTVLEALSMMR